MIDYLIISSINDSIASSIKALERNLLNLPRLSPRCPPLEGIIQLPRYRKREIWNIGRIFFLHDGWGCPSTIIRGFTQWMRISLLRRFFAEDWWGGQRGNQSKDWIGLEALGDLRLQPTGNWLAYHGNHWQLPWWFRDRRIFLLLRNR